jgi:translation initiation factor IF-2
VPFVGGFRPLSAQEFGLQKEKVRVYALARELNIESKDLVDLCRQAGIDVKNQLSSLDPDQREAVEQLVRRGAGAVAVAAPPPPKPVSAGFPTLPSPVPNLSGRPVRREPAPPVRPGPTPTQSVAPPTSPMPAPPPEKTPEAPAAQIAEPPVPLPEPEVVAPRMPEPTTPRVAAETPSNPVTELPAKPPSVGPSKVRDLNQPRPEGARPQRKREIPRPVVHRIAPPPPLKPVTPKDKKKPQEPVAQKPIARPPEVLRGSANIQDIINRTNVAGEVPVVPEVEEEEGEGARGGRSRPGGVAGRDKRHQQRNERARLRKDRGSETERSASRLLLGVEDERPQRVKKRLQQIQQKHRGPTQPRKGKVPIEVPITVRALSEAIGIRSVDLLFKLRDQMPNVTINSTIEADLAETFALDAGCELEIKRPLDAEGQLLSAQHQPDNPEDLVARAPIVTIMGHVDHGKTSLLDKIRSSNVVATEAGGITQVIRAWRVEHGGHPITFLDTPGHEAFTKMRARGAQVTDIAVIVVAADDGVMPQTQEAIDHAKAAEVPIVVAINKVDLPNANVTKTRQQLYNLQLIPDTMGGDTPFVETSATTGKGIDELLDMLSVVAETMLELKANPTKAAEGTCLEAMLSEGEGVRATLLVRNGTLHRGDIVLCGASYGRVRAMYDDLGRPIDAAGPSVPVRITGLDEVPNADDPFLVVPELAIAREVADKRKGRLQEASLVKREPARLEKLSEIKIAELKVILKADFRGSIEAIRKEMDKLQHAEVRVRILHAGIGGITESDVQLALTSPDDTIIVGFNVVPDDLARSLADEKGVQIREYDIIYHLTDDIRAALEGKLKPREEVVHLGRAVVRETFKISRVGTIAGCYVTQGIIERSAKIRLIREGVVIYPPSDRTVGLESLKRFKEDAREVREGFECGLKIAGYDDVKVGDVIEAFRINQVMRTL